MIINHFEKEGFTDTLSRDDMDSVFKLNLDEIWYFYNSRDYDGFGEMLMRKGELFELYSLGHCSCYGPTDQIAFDGKRLDDLFLSLSDEYKSTVSDMFSTAGLRKDLIWISGTGNPNHYMISMVDSMGLNLYIDDDDLDTPFGNVQYNSNVGYLDFYGSLDAARYIVENNKVSVLHSAY